MPRGATQFVDATPTFGGRTFRFRLVREKLDLLDKAAERKVVYFSMHGGGFRLRNGGINFRPVVDSWWAAMGEDREPDQFDYENRVWAEVYRAVNTSRSLQDVYLDAYLSKRKLDREYTLPAAEVERIHELVRSSNLGQVQADLEAQLLGDLPAEREMPVLSRLAHDWIEEGVCALRLGGEECLATWVARVKARIESQRKRGYDDQQRAFIKLFRYEAKTRFHVCYANTWVKLVPWLRENLGLDEYSERFLWLMQTLNRDGDSPGLNRTARRGTLFGQVLSLHPISRFLISQVAYRAAIGRYLFHPDYPAISRHPELIATCPEYLDMATAILCAAHEYAWSYSDCQRRRGVVTTTEGDEPIPEFVVVPVRDDSTPSIALALEEYATARNIGCVVCGGALSFVSQTQIDDTRASVTFRCENSGDHRPTQIEITYVAFKKWLDRKPTRRSGK
jgi:hypothetical protein